MVRSFAFVAACCTFCVGACASELADGLVIREGLEGTSRPSAQMLRAWVESQRFEEVRPGQPEGPLDSLDARLAIGGVADALRWSRGADALAVIRVVHDADGVIIRGCDLPATAASPDLRVAIAAGGDAVEPLLAEGLARWLGGCGAEGPEPIRVEVVDSAPNALAWWESERALVVNWRVVDALRAAPTDLSPPAPIMGVVAWEFDDHAGCMEALRAYCDECGGEAPATDCAALFSGRDEVPGCASLGGEPDSEFGWPEGDTYCAWQVARRAPHVAYCMTIAGVSGPQCYYPEVSVQDVAGLSEAFPNGTSAGCLGRLNTCASQEFANVLPPDLFNYDLCVDIVGRYCATCGSSNLSACEALLGDAGPAGNCTDLLRQENSGNGAEMYCAAQMVREEPSVRYCLSARLECAIPDFGGGPSLEAYTRLRQDFAPYADPRTAEMCQELVRNCVARTPIPPIDRGAMSPGGVGIGGGAAPMTNSGSGSVGEKCRR